MTSSNLHQTLFNIEKLKNAVNVGSCSAYQIYTNPGEPLGQLGTIVDPALYIPANEESFLIDASREDSSKAPTSWFSKALSKIG